MDQLSETAPVRGPRRVSASDRAYEWIRDAILTGVFQEGDFLDEVDLSHEVGTSRTPVREALHKLQAERYIEILPRRGAQVHVISARELEEVYATRLVIESHAASEIISQGKQLPPSAMSLVETHHSAGLAREWNKSAQLDQEIHALIVAQAGNEVLSGLYNSLRPQQVRLAVRTISTAPDRLATIHAEHVEIVEAINNGELDVALDALKRHVTKIPSLMQTFK